MKNILTIFLCLTISNTGIAQEKIAVIDYEKVINSSPQKFEFDYVAAEIDSFVIQLGREQVAVYQRSMEKTMKRYQGGCANLEEMNKMEEDLKKQQEKLFELERFMTDTLSLFRQELDYEFRKLIQKEIEEYRKFSGIEFIGDTNTLYFYMTTIEDISYRISFQLKQKYNLPHRKLAHQQVIFNIKERYNLNQDLHERFSYAILEQNSR